MMSVKKGENKCTVPVIALTNKGKHHIIMEEKQCLPAHSKSMVQVPRIEFIDGKSEIVYDEVETWFPESWEVKNVNSNFIKKTEVTYKMSIPEAKLIEYAFENGYIKEEIKND